MKLPLAACCALAVLIGPSGAAPQDDPSAVQVKTRGDLHLQVFRSDGIDAARLLGLYQSFDSNDVLAWCEDEKSMRQFSAVRVLGPDALVLYDTQEGLRRRQALLDTLAAEMSNTQANAVVLEEAREVFRPSYLSLQAAMIIASSLESPDLRISPVADANTLVLRGPVAEVRRAVEALDVVDHRPPQALVRCWLVVSQDDAREEGRPVPAELSGGLSKITGVERFVQVGSSMLLMSAEGGPPRMLQLRDRRYAERTYDLSLLPTAIDPESMDTTFSDCEFSLHGESGTIFRTAATVEGGEYTVLASTGAEAMYVVLRCDKP